MENNNKSLSIVDDLLEDMTSEIENFKSHRNCPLGLTEEFKHLPRIMTNMQQEQKENFKEIKDSMQKITDTILDTDKGMVIRVKSLESTKGSLLRWFWIVLASGTTIAITKYIATLL